jgi:hypothetical protein
MAGRCRAYHVTGAGTTNPQRYAIRTNAANTSLICGGWGAANLDYYCRVEGGANTQTTVIGCEGGTSGVIHDGTSGKLISVGNGGGAGNPTIQAKGGAVQDGVTAPTFSTNITLDASAGEWQTITATSTTTFTIAQPTNPPDANHSQELTVEIVNSSGGTMGAITWSGTFKFAGFTWANPASTKKRYVTFRWNGVSWVAQSMSSADY